MFKQVAQPRHQLQPAKLSRQQPPGFCSALHWSGFTSSSIFAWEVFLQVNLERTYLSGDQLERLIREMSSIRSSILVKGRWRLKKLNLSFNNMSSLPPAMLARFVRNLEQVISYWKVVMALHGLLPLKLVCSFSGEAELLCINLWPNWGNFCWKPAGELLEDFGDNCLPVHDGRWGRAPCQAGDWVGFGSQSCPHPQVHNGQTAQPLVTRDRWIIFWTVSVFEE